MSQECRIKPTTGEITIDGVSVSLRPKTFELLLLLAQRPNHVFSKQEILASVWRDTVVEDQVIFQSINEIRKETGLANIIKTYPRRGYSWEATNTIIDEQDNNQILETATQKIEPPEQLFTNKQPFQIYAVFALVILFMCYLIADKFNDIESTSDESPAIVKAQTHNGILVLPFNVQSLEGSQRWLKFGAMEGLIGLLTPTTEMTVFRVEDVIDILNRLPNSNHSNVDSIFAKSGASYILYTSISGQPGELNVVFNIYSRSSRITRVINSRDIETTIQSLAGIFEEVYGEKVTDSARRFDSQLQNELVAKAMKFLEIDDYKSALTFIESALIDQPNNVAALYFSSKINLTLNNIPASLTAINTALALNDSQALEQYKHRLYYLKGVAQLSSRQWKEAEATLLDAEVQAKANKDWLYYAYSQSMLGKLWQFQQRFDDAYNRFNAALKYQELLNCPFGIAQGHLDLAELHLSNSNLTLAQNDFEIAKKLVEQRQLEKVKPLLKRVEQLISAKNTVQTFDS